MYYKHFNFISEPLKDVQILKKIDADIVHFKIPSSELNDNLFDLINNNGLLIEKIEVFKLDAIHNKWPIHVDGPIIGDYPKINFVYNNYTSPFIFYKRKNDQLPMRVKNTKIGTEYIYFNPYEVEEVDRTFVQSLTIVQAGVPHAVILDGYRPRWSISINVRLKNDLSIPSFDYVVNLFNNILN